MRDRPIIFSAPMVRALLDGRKTQTRRVLKPQPRQTDTGEWYLATPAGFQYLSCPHLVLPYEVGDRLWVREAHAMLPRTAYRGSIGTGTIAQIEHPTDGYSAAVFREGFDRSGPPKWRPSIHMPRWASRLTLLVTDVRVQRLRQISEADAMAEGMELDNELSAWRCYLPKPSRQDFWLCPRESFRTLWDSLHGQGAWNENPWVCATTFTVHSANIDTLEPAHA